MQALFSSFFKKATKTFCFFLHCSLQVAIVHFHDIAQEGHEQYGVRRHPGKGIGEAEGIDRRARRIGIDRAACDQRRQQQAHAHACGQLGRARAEHELRLADALHTVAHDEDEAEEEVERQVDIEIGVAVAHRLRRDLIG